MTSQFKLDHWARELVVDPLSKQPLIISEDESHLLSPYGRKYPIVNGIYDLRLLNNEITRDQKLWKKGQHHYEEWSHNLAVHDHDQNYFAEIEGVKEVYDDITIEGDCLDVGGYQGRLRRFLAPGQKYVTCDPFSNVFDNISKQSNLIKAYPFLLGPVNFVCCEAEFLPFKSSCFDTVHMRSIIDHLLNPELAINEAYRVLRDNGNLIVGLYVIGGKNGKVSINRYIKELLKDEILPALGVHQFKDHHVWHPTFKELTELISDCGFKIVKVHWQKGFQDTVCYIKATKQDGLTRRCT
jgi:ubiquinone/menaquinone biosynthesis C-methylase UbiE